VSASEIISVNMDEAGIWIGHGSARVVQ
jgi:hypothetical protein